MGRVVVHISKDGGLMVASDDAGIEVLVVDDANRQTYRQIPEDDATLIDALTRDRSFPAVSCPSECVVIPFPRSRR